MHEYCVNTHIMRIFFGKKVICFPPSFLAHDIFPLHNPTKTVIREKRSSIVQFQTLKLTFLYL